MSRAPDPAHLRPLRLLALDVDGVLTRGEITWGEAADGSLFEAKSFSARDGLGLGLARAAGLEVAWVTGRASPVVTRRAEELGVTHVLQGARDKGAVLTALLDRLGLTREATLYAGDDLNDLPAFAVAGVTVAVADAADRLRSAAHWVTAAPGGGGAVREVVDAVLAAQGRTETAEAAFLARLRGEQRPLQ